MYVMSLVGVANVISLAIEVPILLRSLADSLADIQLNHLPIGFHPTMLAALDDGLENDFPCRLVGTYACDWWTCNKEPGPDMMLSATTHDQCLTLHWQYLMALNAEQSPVVDPPRNIADC